MRRPLGGAFFMLQPITENRAIRDHIRQAIAAIDQITGGDMYDIAVGYHMPLYH
jgi:hypothetical protein